MTVCAGSPDGSPNVRRCPPVSAGDTSWLACPRLSCPRPITFYIDVGDIRDFGLVRVSGHKNALSAAKGLKSKISDLFLLGSWVSHCMFFCRAIWVQASRVCVDLCSCGIVLTP